MTYFVLSPPIRHEFDLGSTTTAIIKSTCLIIILALLTLVLSPLAHAERLPFKAYTTSDGLADNRINKIVRDSHGFLWFCTQEGLSRFDGYQFTNYTIDQGLPHTSVNDLLETRAGEFWVATNGGLVHFDPRSSPTNRVVYAREVSGDSSSMFTVILTEGADRNASIFTVLRQTRDGTVWCGTLAGLYRLERNGDVYTLRLVEIGMTEANPQLRYIEDVLEDHFGTLWIASNSGLYRRWPDGTVARYTTSDGLPNQSVLDLLEDHLGQLWAATRYAGFFRITADASHSPPIIASSYQKWDGVTTWVFQLFETTDHRFWIASNSGLAEFFPNDKQGLFRTYTTRNGLTHYEITALNEDAGGNLWLGTNASGAMKLARTGFVTYDDRDGIVTVNGVFADNAGGVCFRGYVLGNEHSTVFDGAKLDVLRAADSIHFRYGRFDGQHFTWFKPDQPRSGNFGWVGEDVTLQTRNGEWWLGTGEGLYRYGAADNFTRLKRARPLAIYQAKEGLKGFEQVFRIFEDSKGRIWTSTTADPNGLARWDQETPASLRDFSNAPGLPSPVNDLARSFGEDRNGDVWIGFGRGVARYRQDRFEYFTPNEGLPPGAIQHIYLDRERRLWLSSSRSGLIRVDEPDAERPRFVSYTTAQGLSSNAAGVIVEDLNGSIYVSTGRGLDRLDPDTGRIKHFTSADGLAGGEMLAAICDRDGVLWFGTQKGLSRLTPGTELPATQPPVLLTGILVGGERQHISALGEANISLKDIAHDRNDLQIEFVGISYAPGEVLRYEYRLDGVDAAWKTANSRTVNYAGLAPGGYRFLVRAVNSDGVESAKPAAVTFNILPPVWQRWWFILLVASSFALLSYWLYRSRLSRLLAIERMRTRIATDLHDDIGANLTKIAILSEVAKQLGDGNEERDRPLSSIARISRESVESMSDIVWAINPQRDHLRDLVGRMRQHAEETCLPREVVLSFDETNTEEDLTLGVGIRRDFYLVFKEAVSNAVRHSSCSHLWVTLSLERNRLIMEVRDDGAGFDADAIHEGNGLLNMRHRAEKLSGELLIRSHSEQGTTLTLSLPISRSTLRPQPTQLRR